MSFLAIAALTGVTGCLENQVVMEPGTGSGGPTMDSPRVTDGLQVLYTFGEGEGLVVKDSSGVEPAFDLHLDNLVNNKWIPGGGIEIVGRSVITSPDVADKVFAACVQANAVTLETWILPANATQSGTILSYNKQGQRNVSLSVSTTRYAGAVRTSRPDPDTTGETILENQTVQTPENYVYTNAQHVVYTRDVTGATVYVDGIDTRSASPASPADPAPPPTDLNEWSPTYQLTIGAETSASSPWLGQVYLAAIYCRRLTTAEVQKNFGAGY